MVRAERRRIRRLRPLCAAAAVCGLALTAATWGSAEPPDAVSSAGHGRFDSNRAWALVQKQLKHGQRPAGSPQLQKLARDLRPLLPGGHFEAVAGENGLRNIVGTLPGRRPGLVIGAHYDTLSEPEGFVGANNGAAGTAIVIELARALAATKPKPGAREIRFVLFDGEEAGPGWPEDGRDFYDSGLRGSRAYVAAHPGRTAEMVLLDYVGNKGLRLPREGSSTPWLWARLRTAAHAVGALTVFPRQVSATIADDHTPFLREGVPSIDLIDWSYPGHDLGDTLDKLSRRSLDAVGETVAELALRLR